MLVTKWLFNIRPTHPTIGMIELRLNPPHSEKYHATRTYMRRMNQVGIYQEALREGLLYQMFPKSRQCLDGGV